MECKAQASSGLRRICNTVKEQRSLQRRNPPRASAERLALPVGRPTRRLALEEFAEVFDGQSGLLDSFVQIRVASFTGFGGF